MGWTKRWRKRLRALVRQGEVERELDEELAYHLELETQKNLRAGMTPEEARRQAAIAFGGVERYKEEVRDARALAWVRGMSLDFKLGARMLVRYPGITLVGGLAIALAIAVGAAGFEVVTQVVHPSLPLEEGDRIVGVRQWDAATNEAVPVSPHDYEGWRESLRSVEELGAFRTVERSLITGEGEGAPVQLSEISASGFRVPRVPPLLGRPLVAEDERPGAEPVAVIGYDLWQSRFGGDPGVVGRDVRLGSTVHRIVGVMPEGFAFPINDGLWVPLRVRASDHPVGEGPGLRVFGRLAPGASLREAQAELRTLGGRAAADFPGTHEHLRPEVLPYAESIFPIRIGAAVRAGAYSVNLIGLMFLALVCANVAALVFARTATRASEIVVRNALGASRARIILQLFVEALVLAGAAAILGLLAARLGLRWGAALLEGELRLPFWLSAELRPVTVLYAGVLTVVGAVIAGALPALRITGRDLRARLQRAGTGAPAAGFGRIWTAVIVTQVAVTVAFPIAIASLLWNVADARSVEVGIATQEFLTATLEMDREAAIDGSGEGSRDRFLARFAAEYAELERRLEAEPGVAGVTFADLLPRMDHPQRRIEVEGMPTRPEPVPAGVSSASVDVGYFEVLGADVLSGRAFHPGDLGAEARVVVVNRSFVERVLGGRNPIGLRVRYAEPGDADEPRSTGAEGEPWHEVVGVVEDLGMTVGEREEGAGVYHPVAPGAVYPMRIAVRVQGDPVAFAARLGAVAAEVEPGLRVYAPLPMDQIPARLLRSYWFALRMLILAGAIALLLATAGIYSVLSFTVARRTREIGIRIALGADRRRIVLPIFARALAQVGLGIFAGAALIVLADGGIQSARFAGMIAASVALMMGVSMIACMVPTRRALSIEPTEALRAEG